MSQIAQMSEDEINRMTEAVIGCAYQVGNTFGFGFLEKVYENSLAIAIRKAGFSVEQQRAIVVRYEGEVVGEYVADLIVEGFLLVEVKCAKAIDDAHKAQCINYLRATRMNIGLLINFGPKVEVRRFRNSSA